MIKTFADRETEQLFITGKSKRLPADLVKRALRRLEYVTLASELNDLRVPPSDRLHSLQGDRAGQYSISLNDHWRICFRCVDGDAFDVADAWIITSEHSWRCDLATRRPLYRGNTPGFRRLLAQRGGQAWDIWESERSYSSELIRIQPLPVPV